MLRGSRIAVSQAVSVAIVLGIIVVAAGAGATYLASQPNHQGKKTLTLTSTGQGNSTLTSGSENTTASSRTLTTTSTFQNSTGTQACVAYLDWPYTSLLGVQVGSYPYDLTPGLDGELFVTNNGGYNQPNGSNFYSVSVINVTDLGVIATIPVNPSPWGVAYDSANQEVYVSTEMLGSVSVINATSDELTANVSVGSQPTGVVYDSLNGEIYVSNSLSNSVSVIKGTSVVATINVGRFPTWETFDNSSGDIYVSNLNNVSVINGKTDTVVATIPDPPVAQSQGIAYDPSNDEIYLVLNNTNSILAIDARTNKIVGNISVNAVHDQLAYDPANGLIFAPGNGSIDVIQGSTNELVAEISIGRSDEYALTYDSYTNEVYFANAGSDMVYSLNSSYVGMIAANPPGSMCGATSTLSSTTTSTTTNETIVTSTGTNSTTTNTPVPNSYVLQKISTNFSVGDIAYDSNPNVNAFFVTPDYYDSPALSNGTPDNDVFVVSAASDTVTNISIPVGQEPVDVLYDPDNGLVYVLNSASSTLSVINATVFSVIDNISLQSAGPFKMAYNPWNQKIYVVDEYGGIVRVVNPSTESVQQNISASYYPFDIAYDAFNHNMYVTSGTTGIVDVINATLDQQSQQITVGQQSAGGLIAYDPANTYLYYASFNSSQLTVISSSSNKIISNISLEYAPSALAYDPANQEMYVAGNASGGFLYLISSSNESVTVKVTGENFTPIEIISDPPANAMFMTSSPNSIYVIASFDNWTTSAAAPVFDLSSSVYSMILVSFVGCLFAAKEVDLKLKAATRSKLFKRWRFVSEKIRVP